MQNVKHFDGVRAEILMRRQGGWRVEIRESTPHEPGTRHFAATEAHDISVALDMAVPYLASLSQPDPFARLLEKASA